LRARTGGYALGLCRARDGRMYLCDWGCRSVEVFSPDGVAIHEWRLPSGDEAAPLPNFPLLSADQQSLFVSDTRPDGPGIWRFDVRTGVAELWLAEACRAANGLALAPDGSAIYLVESKRPGVVRVPILPDGRAGPKEPFLELPGDEPDGLAFDDQGRLYIAVWHPSRIYRWSRAGLELLIDDPAQDLLHHPTNLAFRGRHELFAANLGGWHLTRIDLTSLAA
jgi:sugar lactone lactonase YvrE